MECVCADEPGGVGWEGEPRPVGWLWLQRCADAVQTASWWSTACRSSHRSPPLSLSFVPRCRTQTPCPFSPTPAPCRRSSRSSRDYRRCKQRPQDSCQGTECSSERGAAGGAGGLEASRQPGCPFTQQICSGNAACAPAGLCGLQLLGAFRLFALHAGSPCPFLFGESLLIFMSIILN